MKYALLFALTACVCQGAADWPRFRGPNGSGVAETTGLPSRMGAQQNVLWKVELPAGHSSPVLSGGRIYVTAADKDKLFTISLDSRTGQILWRREAPRARKAKDRGANTPASPSPVTDGENVYVFFEDFGLLSYGKDGNERWRVPLGPFNAPYGMANSTVLAGGLVLQLCDQDTNSYLLAVDAKSGQVRWKDERPEATHSFSTPLIYQPKNGPAQAIVSGAYQVTGYAIETGEKLWWVRGMAWQAKSVPVLSGDTLYVHSWMASLTELGLKSDKVPSFEEALKQYDTNHDGKLSPEEMPAKEMQPLWFLYDLDKDGFLDEREWNAHRARSTAGNGLYAIKLGGRGDLTDTAVLWRYDKGLANIPSPLLYRGVLYVLREGGILTAFDPKSGAVLKQGRLTGAIDDYFSSPIAADGKIFMVSKEGKLTVVKAGAEWEILSVGDLGEDCWATPAIGDGRIYVRTTKALYCFGIKHDG